MDSRNFREYIGGDAIQRYPDIDKLNAIIIRHATSSDKMCKYFCTKLLQTHFRCLEKLALQKFLYLLKSFTIDSIQIVSFD